MGARAQRRQRRTTDQRAHDKQQRAARADVSRAEWEARRAAYFELLKRGVLVEREAQA